MPSAHSQLSIHLACPFPSRMAPITTNAPSGFLYYDLQKVSVAGMETNILLDWGHVHHCKEGGEMETTSWTTGCSKLDQLLCLQGHSQGVRVITALWAWHSERRRLSLFLKNIILPKWSQVASPLLQHPDLTNTFQRLQLNTLGCVAFSHLLLPIPLTRLPSSHPSQCLVHV